MTDKNYTHLLVILDRSGSMARCKEDMVGGLNELFESQAKLEGKCLVDYVQFDDTYEVVFTDRPVAEAKAELTPRGMTAMLDAIGRAVVDLGVKLAAKPENERPGLVQVVVVTDGQENASKDWSAAGIKNLIAKQEEKYSWDFVFLGANMDAVSVGRQYGFNPGKSLTFNTDNVYAATATMDSYVTATRSSVAGGTSAGSVEFTEKDRKNNSK